MGKTKNITEQLMKIDGLITEARKEGNKKRISELRIEYTKLQQIQAAGIVTVPGDKKPAKKDDVGEGNPQTTIEEN